MLFYHKNCSKTTKYILIQVLVYWELPLGRSQYFRLWQFWCFHFTGEDGGFEAGGYFFGSVKAVKELFGSLHGALTNAELLCNEASRLLSFWQVTTLVTCQFCVLVSPISADRFCFCLAGLCNQNILVAVFKIPPSQLVVTHQRPRSDPGPFAVLS